MSFIPKNFKEISYECYNWAIYSDDNKKKIKCNLKGVDVIIILTRMVLVEHKEVKIPNRIYVSSNDPTIVELFKKYLWQPNPFPNWDKRLWVFKNNPNITLPHVQYELRFFSSEDLLNAQLASENSNFCVII